MHELDELIKAARVKYSDDEPLILGDFNMPNIVWFNNDGSPMALPSEPAARHTKKLS